MESELKRRVGRVIRAVRKGSVIDLGGRLSNSSGRSELSSGLGWDSYGAMEMVADITGFSLHMRQIPRIGMSEREEVGLEEVG